MRTLAIFTLGCLLFLPPLLGAWNPGKILGWPGIYAYLFASWGLIILLLGLSDDREDL